MVEGRKGAESERTCDRIKDALIEVIDGSSPMLQQTWAVVPY